jgi:hypothetical protein
MKKNWSTMQIRLIFANDLAGEEFSALKLFELPHSFAKTASYTRLLRYLGWTNAKTAKFSDSIMEIVRSVNPSFAAQLY